MNYAIVLPAKNEEKDLPGTIESIVNQTLLPVVVLVIDNNSTDHTADIAQHYASNSPYIDYLYDNQEKGYSLGAPIMRLFHKGIDYLLRKDYKFDYIVKMDADVRLKPLTFEKIDEYIKQHTQPLGIISCVPYLHINGTKQFMISPEWHTNGQLKIYNHQCLKAIGGLKTDLGWDCADNIQAMQKNWETKVIPDLSYELSRPIGRFSLKKGAVRQGIGAYKLRHSMFYVFLKMTHDVSRKPYILLSLYYFYGYMYGAFTRTKRTLNKTEGKLLRKLLWKSFFKRLHKREFSLLQKKRIHSS